MPRNASLHPVNLQPHLYFYSADFTKIVGVLVFCVQRSFLNVKVVLYEVFYFY